MQNTPPYTSLANALLLTAVGAITSACGGSYASSLQQSYQDKGGFQEFAADPELHSLRTRFDADREKILADPKGFFALASASTCPLDDAKLNELNGMTMAEKQLEAADSPGHMRAEAVRHSVTGGTCEGGTLRGAVDIRIQWQSVIELPDMHGSSVTPRAMRLEGTMGESGFEGPVAVYSFTGKMVATLTAGNESTKGEAVDFNGSYMAEYYDLKSFTPRVLAKRGLSFGFDGADTMHVTSLVEAMPDGRLKFSSWSGQERSAESILNQDLLPHGWQTTFAQKIGDLDIPETKTCARLGRAVKTNDCP